MKCHTSRTDPFTSFTFIYNTNSVNNASSNVCAYYTNNRPMVAGANVLGVGCTNATETFYPSDYTNLFLPQITSWLTNHPTKRPQYVVLFFDVPSRVDPTGTWALTGPAGVQCQLSLWCMAGWHPFITSFNMRTTNDCKAYIDKVASFGATYSPGKLIISAGAYGNTDYYFDDAGTTASFCSNGVTGVLENGGLSSSIHYASGDSTHDITSAANVAGYISWGIHAQYQGNYFPPTFPTNGDVVFSGASSWYVMTTVESYNGQTDNPSRTQSTFLDWFSQFAFGGSNYEHYPCRGGFECE